jgi:hypothetical protein
MQSFPGWEGVVGEGGRGEGVRQGCVVISGWVASNISDPIHPEGIIAISPADPPTDPFPSSPCSSFPSSSI